MFQIGDKVIVDNLDVHHTIFVGKTGKVVHIAETWIAILFDNPLSNHTPQHPHIANFAESELRTNETAL